jgi:hypothetical protein
MSGGGPRRLAGGRVCAKPSCRGRGRFNEEMRRGSAREADDLPGSPRNSRADRKTTCGASVDAQQPQVGLGPHAQRRAKARRCREGGPGASPGGGFAPNPHVAAGGASTRKCGEAAPETPRIIPARKETQRQSHPLSVKRASSNALESSAIGSTSCSRRLGKTTSVLCSEAMRLAPMRSSPPRKRRGSRWKWNT